MKHGCANMNVTIMVLCFISIFVDITSKGFYYATINLKLTLTFRLQLAVIVHVMNLKYI